MCQYSSPSDAIAYFRKAGYRICVSSVSPSALPLAEVDLSSPVVFVFGNEKSGCSENLVDNSDELFTIPMSGMVESVNVSVSCAVVASHVSDRARSRGELFMTNTYLLGPHEQRDLYHRFLLPQPNRKALSHSRTMPSKFDVTRIGSVAERQVAKNSMFVQLDGDFDDDDEVSFMREKFRLSPDGGTLMSRFFIRRAKIGALGDGNFDKRCVTIALAVTGLTALSCEAAIATGSMADRSYGLRFRLISAVRKIVSNVNNDYATVFDASGYPNIPLHASESASILADLRSRYVGHAWRAAVEFYDQQEEKVTETALKNIVASSTLFDVAQCISDSARCGPKATTALMATAASAQETFPLLTKLLAHRESERDVFVASRRASIDAAVGVSLDETDRSILQVLMRLVHCADIVSSLHTCAFEKETGVGSRRVLSVRYGLMESIVADGFAELAILDAPDHLKLARGLYEWTSILDSIKAVVA
jgi:SpoU rRNA Methylase family